MVSSCPLLSRSYGVERCFSDCVSLLTDGLCSRRAWRFSTERGIRSDKKRAYVFSVKGHSVVDPVVPVRDFPSSRFSPLLASDCDLKGIR